jgi:hypothetical protein
MRVSLFRMDRMAYAGAKGITVCIFPDGRTGYSKDDKNNEQGANDEQGLFSVDTE